MSLKQQLGAIEVRSVETQVFEQTEQKHPAQKEGKETPRSIQEQITEIFKALTSKRERDAEAQTFLLHVVQPGLVGFMVGFASTLAPLFATAFATHIAFTAFLVWKRICNRS